MNWTMEVWAWIMGAVVPAVPDGEAPDLRDGAGTPQATAVTGAIPEIRVALMTSQRVPDLLTDPEEVHLGAGLANNTFIFVLSRCCIPNPHS